MNPKQLRHDVMSLEELWYVILYTEARLIYEENAKEFGLSSTSLVDRAEQVRLGQLKVWRTEIIAQAHVDACNDLLDDLTREFEKHLYRFLEDNGVKEPTKDPRYKSYFPDGLGRTINLGLETQVQKTRYFVSSLRREIDPVLQKFAAQFEETFTKADVALTGLRDAQVDRRTHRTNDIIALFEDSNTARQDVYGKLTSRAAEKKLGRDWAESFFKRGESAADEPRDLKRRAILLTFTARGIELSKENRQRINNEDNETLLDAWLSKAGSVTEQAGLFA
jgi:hypothetical protein